MPELLRLGHTRLVRHHIVGFAPAAGNLVHVWTTGGPIDINDPDGEHLDALDAAFGALDARIDGAKIADSLKPEPGTFERISLRSSLEDMAQRDKLGAEIRDLKARNADLRDEVANLRGSLDDMTQRDRALTQKTADLERLLTAKDRTIERHDEALTNARQQRAGYTKLARDRADKIDELKAEVAQRDLKIDELQGKVGDLTEKIADAEATARKAVHRLGRVRARVFDRLNRIYDEPGMLLGIARVHRAGEIGRVMDDLFDGGRS